MVPFLAPADAVARSCPVRHWLVSSALLAHGVLEERWLGGRGPTDQGLPASVAGAGP